MKVWNQNAGDYPQDAVYVGRGSPWGNPFVIGPDGDRFEVIRRFTAEILPTLDLRALRGKDLVCFCAPEMCHADVLMEHANRRTCGDCGRLGLNPSFTGARECAGPFKTRYWPHPTDTACEASFKDIDTLEGKLAHLGLVLDRHRRQVEVGNGTNAGTCDDPRIPSPPETKKRKRK